MLHINQRFLRLQRSALSPDQQFCPTKNHAIKLACGSQRQCRWRADVGRLLLTAVAISLVTGQGVENTKWPAILYSQWISQNRKLPANLNYHIMSIKKSQSILKCFIDLKSSVWFSLDSEDETFVTLRLFSAQLPVKVFKTLNDRQS